MRMTLAARPWSAMIAFWRSSTPAFGLSISLRILSATIGTDGKSSVFRIFSLLSDNIHLPK